jgi:hypothetical protein
MYLGVSFLPILLDLLEGLHLFLLIWGTEDGT